MGPIGMQEMIGLFVIALVLFGPKKLPELGRTLGKALTEFRRAKNELKNTFEAHMNELEKETRIEPVKEFTPPTYSYPYDDYGRYEEPVPAVAAPETHQLAQTDSAEHAVTGDANHTSTDASTVSNSGVQGTVARSNGIHSAAVVDREHQFDGGPQEHQSQEHQS